MKTRRAQVLVAIIVVCLAFGAMVVHWLDSTERQRESQRQAEIDEQQGIAFARQLMSNISSSWMAQYVARGCPEETPTSVRKPGCPDSAYKVH